MPEAALRLDFKARGQREHGDQPRCPRERSAHDHPTVFIIKLLGASIFSCPQACGT